MKKIKILVIQYNPVYLKLDSNLSKFEKMIKKYSYLKPDLVIFPEYALTGPLYGHLELAFDQEDKIFQKLSDLAVKYNINFIPGSFVRNINNKRYNSTCFINSSGKILGFYNKECLWSSEKRFLNSGNDNFVFQTDLGSISLQICADLNSSRISGELRKSKPHLIINLAMWSFEDGNNCVKKVPDNIQVSQVELLTRARAIENRAYMIFCNHAGKTDIKTKTDRIYRETSIGSSVIVNPYGEIISKVTNNQEEAMFAEIDISKTHWARCNY